MTPESPSRDYSHAAKKAMQNEESQDSEMEISDPTTIKIFNAFVKLISGNLPSAKKMLEHCNNIHFHSIIVSNDKKSFKVSFKEESERKNSWIWKKLQWKMRF